MEFRVLKYFLAIAREENMTRAAEFLHVTQPALSKQMMELEQELGKKLFTRGKRKITLTEDGILLRKRAEEMIMLMERTKQELSYDSKEIGGEIAIGGSYSELIVQVATHLHDIYPNIRFHFYSGDAVDIAEKLDNGTLDFGVFIEPIDIMKYEHVSLPQKDTWGFLMRRDCYLAQKPFLTADDISNLTIISPKREELQRQLSILSGKDIEQLNIVATYNIFFHNPTLMVKNGLGCAFTLKQLVHLDENKELCFLPVKPYSQILYSIVWKRYQILSKAAIKFLEVLQDSI